MTRCNISHAGLAERLDQKPRRNVGDDDDGNDPAENKTKQSRENHIRISGDVEKIEVAVNQSLRAHDPETHRGEAEHDRVMHCHAEAERDEIQHHRAGAGHDAQSGKRNQYNDSAQQTR